MTGNPSSYREEGQRDSCTGVATAFTAVSLIIVALRVYTRCSIVRNFGKDDVMMIVALLFAIGYLVAIYILRENGMGFSGANLTLNQMVVMIQTTLAIEIMYYIIVFSIKVSILFVYLRFAFEKHFRRACKATIALLIIFAIICIICCVTQCVPLHKMWDFTGMVEGHCINTTAFFYFTSSFNIVTDIWIIALPIKTLLQIQRPYREKAGLIAVFALGVFSCIAAIVRLHSIRIYTESKDPFYDSVPINLWSEVEINIGIWCASIPTLRALISKSQRERTRSTTRGGAYQYHSRGRSGGKFTGERVGGSSGNGQVSQGARQSDVIGMGDLGSALQHSERTIRKESRWTVERDGSEDIILSSAAESKA